MKILQHVEALREKTFSHGQYRVLSEKCGVTYHWLQKFSIGVISNPTVENVSKLEAYFDAQNKSDLP